MSYDPVAQMQLEEKKRVVEHDKLKTEVRGKLQDAALERVPHAYREAKVLPLVFFPDTRLKQKCVRVETFDAELREFAANMGLTMYLCGGVGLAAPQVGDKRRLIVADWGEKRGQLQVLVNPELLASSADKVDMQEGCLSIPGARVRLERPEHVTLRYQSLDGRTHDLPLTGWPSRIVQHELDHLEGRLMLDHVSPLERRMAVRGLEKMRKRETAPKNPRKPKRR